MRVFFIPHAPATKLKTRSYELAKSFSKLGHTVEIYAYNVNDLGHQMNFVSKICWHINELLPRIKRIAVTDDKITRVYLPTLHYGPAFLKRIFLNLSSYIIKAQKYDLIVSAAYEGIPIRLNKNQLFIYDYVDDHGSELAGLEKIQTAKTINYFILKLMKKANIVLCSSHVLQQKCLDTFNIKSVLIPNGATISLIRSCKKQINSSVCKIGYVGGLDSWVKLGPVIEAIKNLRNMGYNYELHIVGKGNALKEFALPEWVICHGLKMPNEIPLFLKTFDIGILPFEINSLTNAALPLKIIEYGAAQIIAIASPIKELTIHQFPWVIFSEMNKDSWEEAILQAQKMTWNSKWDEIVNHFDWDNGARKILTYVKSNGVKI